MTTEQIRNRTGLELSQNDIEQILIVAGNQRWSVLCDRIAHYCDNHNVKPADVFTTATSDYHWASRRNRTEKNIERIGATAPSGKNTYYIYIYTVEAE